MAQFILIPHLFTITFTKEFIPMTETWFCSGKRKCFTMWRLIGFSKVCPFQKYVHRHRTTLPQRVRNHSSCFRESEDLSSSHRGVRGVISPLRGVRSVLQFYFDASTIENKKANEKSDLVYELKEIKENKTIVFSVYNSAKDKVTKTDEYSNNSKRIN